MQWSICTWASSFSTSSWFLPSIIYTTVRTKRSKRKVKKRSNQNPKRKSRVKRTRKKRKRRVRAVISSSAWCTMSATLSLSLLCSSYCSSNSQDRYFILLCGSKSEPTSMSFKNLWKSSCSLAWSWLILPLWEWCSSHLASKDSWSWVVARKTVNPRRNRSFRNSPIGALGSRPTRTLSQASPCPAGPKRHHEESSSPWPLRKIRYRSLLRNTPRRRRDFSETIQ